MPTAPYVLLFAPACILLIALIWREAGRRGLPGDRVAAAIAACAVGAVIGSKVLMFDFHAAQYGEKTFLGAVAGGMLILAAVSRVLRFDATAFDVPILPVLWAAAVGRLGCFVAGCCHGIATALPWGVHYESGSAAFRHQIESGLLATGAATSLPVHPTQLYEAALDVALALLLTRMRHRLRRPGSLALAGVAGIAMIRFTVEPWRATGVPFAAGLTVVQWTTFVLGMAAAMVLIIRERRAVVAATVGGADARVVSRGETRAPAFVLAAVATLFLVVRGWLTPLETLVLVPVLLVAGGYVVRSTLAKTVLATPLVGLAALLPLQLPDSATAAPSRPDTVVSNLYYSLGGSAAMGGFEVVTEDCEGRTTSTTAHRFTVGGVNASVRRETAPGVGRGLRLGAFHGWDNADRPVVSTYPPSVPLEERRDRIAGGSVVVDVDFRYIGLAFGAVGGRWRSPFEQPSIYAPSLARSQALPVAALRLGRKTALFGEIAVNTQLPAPVPGPVALVGLGVGNRDATSLFRFGISDFGVYAGGEFVSATGLEFHPFGVVGPEDHFQVGVGLRKRFYRGR